MFEQIDHIVYNNDVVLFMKGIKSMPQCGFSSKVAGALNYIDVDFADVDRIDEWVFWINRIFNTKKNFKYLKNNAKKTAMNFTWQKRSKKILDFAKKKSLI